jgi:hypothetical protein
MSLGLSTMSVYTGIRPPVIWVPSPSCLALKEQFDGTVDGPVTTRIRPSSDGRYGPYYGHTGMSKVGLNTLHCIHTLHACICQHYPEYLQGLISILSSCG